MFFITLIFIFPISCESNSVPIPIYMDEMLNAGRNIYDKQSTPTQHSGNPTTVNISMYIEGLSSFRTQTMDFQLDVYLQQFWTDYRMKHNESKRILIRDIDILGKIWHPDIYFANARIAEFHEVTQPNFLLWLEPDGSILYDTRVSMIVMCTMNLAKWPLDSQHCKLRILSYAYDVNQLILQWNLVEPITRNDDITLSDMQIVKLIPGLCDGNYSTGSWSCVTAEFYVQRKITHHIMQSYVPTSLIVIISWFSFWLDVEAVPARVSLAITTLLTLSTQASTARMALPEVSYAKAIDVWSSSCMLFVFGVMIEFTVCNFVQRQTMNQLQNGPDPGLKRRKSCVTVKDPTASEPTGTNIGSRAKNLIDRAMGRAGEHRHLIETSVDEYGTPETTDRRQPLEKKSYDNDALEVTVSTPPRRKSKTSFVENGKVLSAKSHNNSIKSVHDDRNERSDRWREREAERLANWARVSVEINEPPSTIGQGSLWNRLKSQANTNETENSQKVHDSTPKSKLSGLGSKWTTAIKQMQQNKKMLARNEAKRIDQFSRWAFPLAFLIFNTVYWTYYIYIA